MSDTLTCTSAGAADSVMGNIRGCQAAQDVVSAVMQGGSTPDALHEALVAARGKRFATARARAALRGIALHALEDDRGAPLYVASQHALTRQFFDLAEVEHWLASLDAAT